MDFGWENNARFCYLPVAVLKQMLTVPHVLDALMEELGVPGKKVALRALSDQEKLAAIERQIEHERRQPTSLWHDVHPAEVLAANIYRACSRTAVRELFSVVGRESDLLGPVAAWLKGQNLAAYAEVPLGTKCIDVLGYRKGGFWASTRVVGVELKNEFGQLKRGLDQMTTFAQYAHVTYLACTPAMAADYLNRHAEARGTHRWDPNIFGQKLRDFGFGLLLVERGTVTEFLKPKERELKPDKLREVEAALARMTPALA